ncbi:C40 family peptidase [Agromyces sp. Marseille-P2726]|uniref:C40 family peptidase n=1 Tax=Agromyces sp. Marseille-P2726 TaxID=2709132 RepID=UPI00156F2F0F|nr:C40 family peptidase [Agromyces sp. Marseille-P2726]
MSEHRTRPVSRVKPATLFSAVAVGAVTASVVASGGPAMAEPDYPSWSDIEQAKQNEQTKQAEIARVADLLTGLQRAADAAVQASMMADEAYRVAVDQRDRAASRERALGEQADQADAVAEISKMRAGLLAAHLAKTAGADLSATLAFSGDTGLLEQLGMASKLGEQSNAVYEQAIADRNTADALREQAADAAAERERLAALAEAKADDAREAADAANAAVTVQEQKSEELYAQLASLKDTTAELERQRFEGQAREAAEAAAAAAEAARRAQQAPAPVPAAPPPAPAPGGSTGGGPAPAAPAPAPAAPAPPDAGAVETAIWFASQQLGKPYRLGGAGPNVWDCSGLTKVSYAQAGISIGTHPATNQYRTLAARGLAVPLSQIQRGDLLFWGGGGDYYHVAIYLGGGRIIEAPRDGVPVREYFIWGSPAAAARPAG